MSVKNDMEKTSHVKSAKSNSNPFSLLDEDNFDERGLFNAFDEIDRAEQKKVNNRKVISGVKIAAPEPTQSTNNRLLQLYSQTRDAAVRTQIQAVMAQIAYSSEQEDANSPKSIAFLKYKQRELDNLVKLLSGKQNRTTADFKYAAEKRQQNMSFKQAAIKKKEAVKPLPFAEYKKTVGDGYVINHIVTDPALDEPNTNRDHEGPSRKELKSRGKFAASGFDADEHREMQVSFQEEGGFVVKHVALPKHEKTYFAKVALNVAGPRTKEQIQAQQEKLQRSALERKLHAHKLMNEKVQAEKAIKNPKQIAYSTSAQQLLTNPRLNFSKAHPKEVARLKGNAKTWVQDQSYHGKRAYKTELGAYARGLSLSYRGKAVYDTESFKECVSKVRNPAIVEKLTNIYTLWKVAPKVKANIDTLFDLQKEFSRVANAHAPPTDNPVPFAERRKLKASKATPQLEGNSMGSRITQVATHTATFSFDGVAMIKQAFGGNDELTKIIVHFLSCCLSIYECSSPMNIVANLTAFVTNHFYESSSRIIAWITSQLKVFFDYATMKADDLAKFGSDKKNELSVRAINAMMKNKVNVEEKQAGAAEYHDFAVELESKEGETEPKPDVEDVDDLKEFGFRNMIKNMFTKYDASSLLASSALGQSLWGVLSTLSISSIFMAVGFHFDLNNVMAWKKKLETFFVGKDGLETFFQRLLRFTSLAVDSIREAFTTGDWKALFSGKSFKEWLWTAEVILDDMSIRLDAARPSTEKAFKEQLAAGKFPPRIFTQLTTGQRFDIIEELLEEYASYVSFFQKSGDIMALRSLEKWQGRLHTEKYALKNNITNGEYRVEPFGIFIHGPPGTGKSDFSEILHKALGRSRGLPMTADSRYSHVEGTNFYDNFTGAQWVGIFDDVDTTTGTPTVSDMTHVKIVQNIINKKPLMMEQAAVEAKGTKFCNFQAVIYCTNFKFARLQHFTLEPLAFWRRFGISIEMKVRDEYATKTGRLDHSKLDGSNDYWVFKIGLPDDSKFDVANIFTSFPFREFKALSLAATVQLICKMFNEKIDREQTRLTVVNEAMQEYCRFCFLPDSIHPKIPCRINLMPESKMPELQSLTYNGVTVDVNFIPMLLCMVLVYYGWLQYIAVLATLFLLFGKFLDFVNIDSADFGPILVYELQRIYTRSRTTATQRFLIQAKEKVMTGVDLYKRYEEQAVGALKEMDKKTWIVPAMIAVAGSVLIARQYFKRQATLQSFTSDGVMLSKGIDRPAYVRAAYVRDPLGEVALSTTSFEQLCKNVEKRLIRVETTDGKQELVCIQIVSNVVLIPGHLLLKKKFVEGEYFDIPTLRNLAEEAQNDEIVLRRGNWKYQMKIVFGVNAVKAYNREYFLVVVPGLTPVADKFDFLKHVATSTVVRAPTGFDKLAMITREQDQSIRTQNGTKGTTVWPSPQAAGAIQTWGFETKPGDCGSPLVVQVGKLVYIAGYHAIVMKNKTFLGFSDHHLGEELTSLEIKAALLDLTKMAGDLVPNLFVPSLESNSKKDGEETVVRLVPLEERSSLWAAASQGFDKVAILGTIEPKFPLSSLKSKLKESPLRYHFSTLEERICGVYPYYTTPKMNGAMVDKGDGQKVWIDPYIVNMCNMKNKHSDDIIWRLAKEDFMEGMEFLPGIKEIVPLTDEEVWRGVQGEINAINLKTSMGPPHFQKKKAFFKFEDEGTFVREDIQKHIELIQETLDSGCIFVPLCVHSLKDEAVSQEKHDAFKTRVFNTMSTAYNANLKKYVTPLASFMRKHWKFFESAVGLDVTSWDADEIVNFMISVFNKKITLAELREKMNSGDGDFQYYDITLSSQVRLMEAEFWKDFAGMTSYSARDQQRTHLLVLGTMYTMRYIKNDLFIMAFSNPSGSNITINTNDVCNSLSFRYCYYAEKMERAGIVAYELTMSLQSGIWPKYFSLLLIFRSMTGEYFGFRTYIHLITLGDDNWFTVADSALWFNYEVLGRRMVEAGQVYTAADKKSTNLALKTVFDCSFLKRSFEFEDGRWKARIELKSIVKMLAYLKDSDLGEKDHCAVLVSNACRELYFHGEEIFEEWMVHVDAAVVELALEESLLLSLFTYQQLDKMFHEKKYPKWLQADRAELFNFAPLQGATTEEGIAVAGL